MRYLHAMVRVRDLGASLKFFCGALGLAETRRKDYPQDRFTLVYLAAPDNPEVEVELTFNYDDAGSDESRLGSARNFGHLAFGVDDIYAACERLQRSGVTINRPPRDGRMAFVRSPDQISIELLQNGAALPPREPWLSMANSGTW